MSAYSVQWPIEGGLLAAAPGGHLRLQSAKGRLVASVDGYAPRLPKPIYELTQLPFHRLVTRLQLLRVRGGSAPGVRAEPSSRLAAGAIDVSLCAGLSLFAGRGRRGWALLGITAGYHIACWSTTGRTLGGVITKQRVVSADGSRVTGAQATLRFIALPLAAVSLRAIHDEVAGTDVIAG